MNYMYYWLCLFFSLQAFLTLRTELDKKEKAIAFLISIVIQFPPMVWALIKLYGVQ